MKEFLFTTIYKGIHYRKRFCAKTNKEAIGILDMSAYEFNQYVSKCKARTEFLIDNPGKLYVERDLSFESRWVFEFNDVDINALVQLDEFKMMVDKFRDKFPTSRDSNKFYNR